MKKIFSLSLVAVFLPSLALARGNHPMAGCGLGYLLFSHQDNAKVTQVLGATTNGTFGTQTFGITSGTSGCTKDGALRLVRAVEVYADVNLDSLRREMASGQGEFVETFATLLGATDATRPALLQFFRTEYTALFPTSQTSSMEMLDALNAKLAQHRELLG